MHVSAINSSYNANYQTNKNQNFGKLIKDKSVFPIIRNMSKADKIEFSKLEQRLSKTKFWDMKISAVGDKFKELKFHFINKKNNHEVITDGIYPYNKEDNTIHIYSIFYGPQNNARNLVKTLTFSSKERADKVYDTYMENHNIVVNNLYNLTPIERLKSKEIELKMLEEGYRNKNKQQAKVFKNTDPQTKWGVGNDLRK